MSAWGAPRLCGSVVCPALIITGPASGSNSSVHAEQPDSGPLVQFSIHSLPDPSRSQAQRTRRGRLKMLAVWAVCAAPVVASYYTYYVMRPQGRVNYGQLIQPPISMPADASWSLHDLRGNVVLPSSLRGNGCWLRWLEAPATRRVKSTSTSNGSCANAGQRQRSHGSRLAGDG